MVKPLSFKGDKKVKKRKRDPDQSDPSSTPANSLQKTSDTRPPAAPANDDDDDTTWVTADNPADIAGPIIIVLPSSPPSALASDINGSIFASTLENIVDDDPGTAEPHDVRQVWVANRVAGSDKFGLKGHHGKYLGCDKFGVLRAVKEAVGLEEGFALVPAEGYGQGWFCVQAARDTFLSLDEEGKNVRADVEEVGFKTAMRIRMQARFKPKLRVAKEERKREKISRKELEEMVGRRLEEDEVRKLKRARREGGFHEAMLDVKVKGKHDKFA